MIKRLFLVNVLPGSRLVAAPGQRRPVGYFQRFGVTADDEAEMLRLIQDYIHEDIGGSIVEIENQGEPDFEDLDSEIRDIVGNTQEHGFWYKSGHAFYLDEVDETNLDRFTELRPRFIQGAAIAAGVLALCVLLLALRRGSGLVPIFDTTS